MCPPCFLVIELIGRRKPRNFHDWPDFNSAETSRRDSPRNGDGIIEIFCVDEVKTAELLTCFRKRSVRYQTFAFTDTNTRRRRNGMERRGIQILAARMNFLREPCRLHIAVRTLGLGHALLIKVNQQHVLHLSASTKSVEQEEFESTLRRKIFILRICFLTQMSPLKGYTDPTGDGSLLR